MTLGQGPPVIQVFEDASRLTEGAADLFVQWTGEAISQRGACTLALSGGSTPQPLYQKLASSPHRDGIDWRKVQVFLSDERFVPRTSSESNYRMANESLFSQVALSPANVHAVVTEGVSPDESARAYQREVEGVVKTDGADLPAFDIILLGLGPDGHTASLFPGTTALSVADRLVAANYVEKLETWRITFTYPLLNASRKVVFLVEGGEKASMVQGVLAGHSDLPASHVIPSVGETIWLLDESAAGGLKQTGPVG